MSIRNEVQEPVAFTVPETARLLRIGLSLAYECARDGRLPVVKLGRRFVVPAHKLRALLDGDWPQPGASAVEEPVAH
jgi:excisionase family DNA binding protein